MEKINIHVIYCGILKSNKKVTIVTDAPLRYAILDDFF